MFCLQLMKKLNRQERVVEEVKLAIKPYYNKGKINKDEYKEIMRKAVPKVIVVCYLSFVQGSDHNFTMFSQPKSFRMGGGGSGHFKIEKHEYQFQYIFP